MITNQEYKLLQKENKQLQKELEVTKCQSGEYERMYFLRKEELEQVKKELEDAKREAKNLDDEGDELNEDLVKAVKELEGITAERDHYRVGVNNLTKERDEFRRAMDKFYDNMMALEKEDKIESIDHFGPHSTSMVDTEGVLMREEEEEREQSYSLEEIEEHHYICDTCERCGDNETMFCKLTIGEPEQMPVLCPFNTSGGPSWRESDHRDKEEKEPNIIVDENLPDDMIVLETPIDKVALINIEDKDQGEECPECEGKGRLQWPFPTTPIFKDCKKCKGTGKVDTQIDKKEGDE